MGLFDSLIGGGDADQPFTKAEAILAVLTVVVAIDGNISDEEAEGVVAISNRMKALKSLSSDQFNAAINKIIGLIRKKGHEVVLKKAAESIPQDLKATVFALSADMIFADGAVEPQEAKLLEAIQRELMVADDVATKVVEVLQLKNRG